MQQAQQYAFRLFLSGFMCENVVMFCLLLFKFLIPEKRSSFHNMLFKNKKLAEKWLDQLCRDARFVKKNLRMSMFVKNSSQWIVTKSLTDTKCWVQRQGRGD